MYRRILVGYDNSDQSNDALALGKTLADATSAELVVAGVFQCDPLLGGRDPAFREAEVEYAREIERAADAVGAKPEAIPSSSPARGLHELAQELDADLILVGSAHHGRLGQTLAGSVALALLHGSPCAVGIAPKGYREHANRGIDTLAVGFDGSLESGLALEAAIEVAHQTAATVKLIAVAEPPPIVIGKGGGANQGWYELKQAIEEQLREQLHEAKDTVPDDIDVDVTLIRGEPAQAIASAAGETRTLLLLGSRAYGPLRAVLLGSVSRKLVRLAPCPLIVHPRGMHSGPRTTRYSEAQATS